MPELIFAEYMFSLTIEQWDNLLIDFKNQGLENITPTSKQYLEDCKTNETHLIAITGNLDFSGITFPFTAQLDVNGFILYINKPHNKRGFIDKLLGKSNAHKLAYEQLIVRLCETYKTLKNA
ncbi:MAG: hypothetical protein WGN25_12300 [Candidatus Electrothrix sp. GW3-4]|uniref:hypothetical protein n=1 Tax=Candidatus Electrothrix sp. GW3-4 TaxID=3126740 RepID=UPI0030CC2F05